MIETPRFVLELCFKHCLKLRHNGELYLHYGASAVWAAVQVAMVQCVLRQVHTVRGIHTRDSRPAVLGQ